MSDASKSRSPVLKALLDEVAAKVKLAHGEFLVALSRANRPEERANAIENYLCKLWVARMGLIDRVFSGPRRADPRFRKVLHNTDFPAFSKELERLTGPFPETVRAQVRHRVLLRIRGLSEFHEASSDLRGAQHALQRVQIDAVAEESIGPGAKPPETGISCPSAPRHPEERKGGCSARDEDVFKLLGKDTFRSLTNAEIAKGHRRRLLTYDHHLSGNALKCVLNRIRKAYGFPMSNQIRKETAGPKGRG